MYPLFIKTDLLRSEGHVTTPQWLFVEMATEDTKGEGWRKLRLLASGREVGQLTFRWSHGAVHDHPDGPYLTAKGGLAKVITEKRFSSEPQIIEMLRNTMAREGWETRLIPAKPDTEAAFQFWVRSRLSVMSK